MFLQNLAVVLYKPKFSENVGSAARACANFGCAELVVVAPQNYDPNRAISLATAKGSEILAGARFCESIQEALAPYSTVYGTSARHGGWRKEMTTPRQMAPQVADKLAQGERLALLYGPEDKGLTNEETRLCSKLIRIPTSEEASSLNLAQAVLLTLYDCALAVRESQSGQAKPQASRPSHAEQEAMFEKIKQTLMAIDFIKPENPEYFMLPLRRFLARLSLKRAEYNLIMGVCRQVNWAIGKGGKNKS